MAFHRLPALYAMAAALPLAMLGYWVADYRLRESPRSPESLKGAPYAASGECRVCHEEHYQSWRATHHSRMTAPATPENFIPEVPPEGLTLHFQGRAVTFRRESGGYTVDLPWQDGRYRHFPLLYTIGSRRMQQFAVRDGDKIWRIPVFYSIEEKRWRHINEAFFRRVDESPQAFAGGYALWNPNCIFCHNTRPNPGADLAGQIFRSTVAETGIACEECHAPGAAHASLNRNPLRRAAYQWSGRGDSSIAHAAKMDKMKSAQTCGQCHGQRLPRPLERIAELMTKGDPFVPGENLFDYYEPVHMGSTLPNYDTFHLRFWKDGSPRLTAYEFQGMINSTCFLKSDSMSCLSCHTMHGGDPKGMIHPEMRSNAACTPCHREYESRQAAEAHSHHAYEDADCYSCHMPEVAYGVLTVHPTHLIRNLSPSRTVEQGMPDACNLCHLDKSVNWAIAETNRLWGWNLKKADSTFDMPEIVRGLAAGDAVYRTVLLHHARKRSLRGFEMLYLRMLEEDEFHVVRRFAAAALVARYGMDTEDPARWRAFLRQQALDSWDVFDGLHQNNDVAFEFGE